MLSRFQTPTKAYINTPRGTRGFCSGRRYCSGSFVVTKADKCHLFPICFEALASEWNPEPYRYSPGCRIGRLRHRSIGRHGPLFLRAFLELLTRRKSDHTITVARRW
jgi:hypothetical protein